MRLIDADALVNTIQGLCAFVHIANGYREKNAIQLAERRAINEMVKMIENAPTIDPFRKGKWIVYVVSMLDGEDCKCSECGQTSCAPYWHYCPNCGVKMEGCEQDG